MSSIVVVLVVALLALVAALGIVAPYRRGRIPALEPLADPLEDRKLALLLALRDLESARGSGALEEADYLRLRDETEGRMARVLRALEEQPRPGVGVSAAEAEGNGGRPRVRSPNRLRWAAIGLVAILALSAALVPALLRSLDHRSSTPNDLLGATSLSYFEQRVRDHPHDVAARLDLAHRYLDAGLLGRAFDEYRAALLLDPRDVDALAHIGILLHLSGKPKPALAAEDRALVVDPTYPEALFFKGVILFKGLDRPAEAIPFLERYLKGSPYGSEGPEARRLLARAREATG